MWITCRLFVKGFFGEPKIASFSIDVPRLVVPGALNKAHKKAE
jgi:hypothetical protein